MNQSAGMKGARVTGDDRARLAADVIRGYENGESIRHLAAECGRSYGFVRGLLVDAGIQLRSRGGATRHRPGA